MCVCFLLFCLFPSGTWEFIIPILILKVPLIPDNQRPGEVMKSIYIVIQTLVGEDFGFDFLRYLPYSHIVELS